MTILTQDDLAQTLRVSRRVAIAAIRGGIVGDARKRSALRRVVEATLPFDKRNNGRPTTPGTHWYVLLTCGHRTFVRVKRRDFGPWIVCVPYEGRCHQCQPKRRRRG